MRFAELTRRDIAALDRDRMLVVAPLGSCEQHGRHLPVFTDSILVTAVAERLEAAREGDVLLLPTLWVGASEHHLPFGATITPDPLTYVQFLVSTYESVLGLGFKRFFFLNGHGGNIVPLRLALRELKRRFPDRLLAGAAYWELAMDEIAALCRGPRKLVGHGGEIETSLLLALHPELVRTDAFVDEPSHPSCDYFVAETLAEQSSSGAVGYPTYATEETGKKLLEVIVRKVTARVDELLSAPLPAETWSTEAIWSPRGERASG